MLLEWFDMIKSILVPRQNLLITARPRPVQKSPVKSGRNILCAPKADLCPSMKKADGEKCGRLS